MTKQEKLEKRLFVEANGIDVFDRNPCELQCLLHGFHRNRFIVFLSCVALLLRRKNHFAVFQESDATVMVVTRYAENINRLIHDYDGHEEQFSRRNF